MMLLNRPALTMHFCSMNTLLTWHGERNYRGVVPVQGVDPFAAEGYTRPEVGAKLEELTKPDNRFIPPRRLESESEGGEAVLMPPTGLGEPGEEGEGGDAGGGHR